LSQEMVFVCDGAQWIWKLVGHYFPQAVQIATLRLKRAGTRWTECGAVQTAKARAAWLCGAWEPLVDARAALPLAA
jgi:hypothetical protein